MKVSVNTGHVPDHTGHDPLARADLPGAKVMIGEKVYDYNAIREGIEAKGGTSVITARGDHEDPQPISGPVHALPNSIEH